MKDRNSAKVAGSNSDADQAPMTTSDSAYRPDVIAFYEAAIKHLRLSDPPSIQEVMDARRPRAKVRSRALVKDGQTTELSPAQRMARRVLVHMLYVLTTGSRETQATLTHALGRRPTTSYYYLTDSKPHQLRKR